MGRLCCWAFAQVGYACRPSCSARYFWLIVTKTGITVQFPVKYCNFKILEGSSAYRCVGVSQEMRPRLKSKQTFKR
jgi:hypothetical protein